VLLAAVPAHKLDIVALDSGRAFVFSNVDVASMHLQSMTS
jgi:hypothetical protein